MANFETFQDPLNVVPIIDYTSGYVIYMCKRDVLRGISET